MKKYFKLVSCLVSLCIFMLCCFTSTSAEKIDTTESYSENTYITSYNTQTGVSTTSKMSDLIEQGSVNLDTIDTTSDLIISENLSENPKENDIVSPNYVFGNGSPWTECNPYDARIACIKVYWKNGYTPTRGTAFVFATDALITSAHCVYDSSKGGWCDYVEVYPARRQNSLPYGTYTSTWIHVSDAFMQSATTAEDYAVVEVDGNVGSRTGMFNWSTSASVNQAITITGYPKYLNNEGTGAIIIKQYTDTGTITSLSASVIRTNNTDESGGNSGSPVYNSNGVVVGIVEGGGSSGNLATRITSDLSSWLYTFR